MDLANRIVVLTALPVETDAVRAHLAQPRRHDLPRGTIVHEATVPGTEYTVCLACTGPGNPQAALVAQEVIDWVNPAALFFVGIAGSLKPDVGIGDIVAATEILAYDGGKQTTDGFKARPTTWNSAHNLLQAAQEANSTGSWARFLPDGVSATPQVHFKPIATGSVVLDATDSPLSDLLGSSYNHAVAIEMEGGGAALAAHHARVPMMVIRGVSDLADGTKAVSDENGARRRAAQFAAALTLGTIAELPPPGRADARTGNASGGTPVSAVAGSTPQWSVLDQRPAVSWRDDLQQTWGTESTVLELHLVPVDAGARLEVRRLRSLRDELVQLGRHRGLFGQAQAVDGGASETSAVAYVREPRTGTNTGLAVVRNGQRSAWEALPKGQLAAILDPDHVTERLAALIDTLRAVQVPAPGRVAPVVGLAPAMLVTLGKVGVPQPTAVTLAVHDRPVRTDPEDAIGWTDLQRALNPVAEEVVARLEEKFRNTRG